jgi:sterol desaturase/sphingolipid hydroxylase (fatty acid hydroxylase superfamily)
MDDLPIRYAEVGGFPIDHNETPPIRLFKSDFLEFFTHITPLAVTIIWTPLIALLFIVSVMNAPASGFPFYIPAGIGVGLFLWTFVEYTLHRFVFHHHPKSDWQKRIVFLFHGIHHAQPQCKTRLVMPPAVSIPMALVVYGLFYLIVSKLMGLALWVNPMMVGLLIGYLAYDLTHYATHHFRMTWGFLKFLKRYHMMHHYKTPYMRFGVSSPLWDVVFRTMPSE